MVAETTQTDIAPIDAIEKAAEEGADIWEMSVSAGLDAADNMDVGRWRIGDLALLLNTAYGEGTIKKFALDLHMDHKRVYEYSEMCDFWDRKNSARAEIQECYHNIRYSHMREARRLGLKKGIKEAEAFIKECSDNDWPPAIARMEVNERLGHKPSRKLMSEEVVISRLDMLTGELMVVISPDSYNALEEFFKSGTPVRLSIHSIAKDTKDAAV